MRGKISECNNCYEVFKTKKLLNEHKTSCPRNNKNDDKDHDVIMLDEDDDGLDVVQKKTNEENVTEKIVSDQKVTPELLVNENINGGEEMEEDEEEEDKDDEIEVVKSDIYKFGGNLNYEHQVRKDVFQFQYFDDFEDNDDIVLLEDEEEEEEPDSDPVDEEVVVSPEEILEKCEECEDLLQKRDLDSHMKLCHPVLSKKVKQFEGGNFFMLAC